MSLVRFLELILRLFRRPLQDRREFSNAIRFNDSTDVYYGDYVFRKLSNNRTIKLAKNRSELSFSSR